MDRSKTFRRQPSPLTPPEPSRVSSLSNYDRDAESGQLKFRSVCEAVTADDSKEGISSSDIVITPDGRFLFAGIRGHRHDLDWITRYRIDENGDGSLIGRTPADKIPWGFTLSPHGEYLFATASLGATITAYKIGKEGSLDKVASIPCDTEELVPVSVRNTDTATRLPQITSP